MDSEFSSPTSSNSSDCSFDLSTTQPTTSNIQYGRLIGKGGFGSVYFAKLDKVKQPVAVKRLHSHIKNVAATSESFEAESRLLHYWHPNIVNVLAAVTANPIGEAIIIMEYAGTHNLQQMINKAEYPFDVLKRIKYTLDISEALCYLHRSCLVHLDVKPANIIINEITDRCKLADFGCSQETMTNTGAASLDYRSRLMGTYAYRAPELLRGHPANNKADIYSLGITMWQMLSLEFPYSGLSQQPVIFAVVRSHLRPTLPAKLQKDCEANPVERCYIELYKQCWHPEVVFRPSANDLVEVLSFWKTELLSYDNKQQMLEFSEANSGNNGMCRRDSNFNVSGYW